MDHPNGLGKACVTNKNRQLKAQELHSSLSAQKRIHPPVIHVVTLLFLPHFLSHNLPQHEAPPGQHDLLQEHSLYTSTTTSTPRLSPRTASSSCSTPDYNNVGKNRYKSSLLCDNKIQSGRTLRTTHSTNKKDCNFVKQDQTQLSSVKHCRQSSIEKAICMKAKD